MKSRSVSSALVKYSKIATLIALSVGVLHSVQAQEFAKIGFVRPDRILSESNLAKSASAKLEAEFAKRQKEIADLETRLKTLADKFDKEAPVLSEAERTKRQRELFELDKDYQRKKRELNEDGNQRRNEEMAVVQEKVFKVIKQVAEAEKYDAVFQDALWASPRIDITDKVLKALNAAK